MWQVKILPKAAMDIREAANWYNQRQSNLGIRFTQEVRKTIDYIRENPEKIAVRYSEVRCAVLPVFPFMIHFKLNKKQKTVIVAAVFHTSLNPSRWQKRI
jgi:plasmid stabilization system protein ParE